MRNLLTEFSELFIELNKLAPDVAELDVRNNLEASRRILGGLKRFETNHLYPFKEKIRDVRKNILSKKK